MGGYVEIYLRDQVTILADVRARVRDANSERWTDTEIYRALNDALLSWQGRVRVPHIHTITNGWVAGQYEYVLPDYITSDAIQPQMKASNQFDAYSVLRLSSDQWVDIPSWRIEPNASNQRVLRFTVSPYSTEGRIIWWGSNGTVPLTVPALNNQLRLVDTELFLGGAVDVSDYGWLHIGIGEWAQYAGADRSLAYTRLINLVRDLPQGVQGVTTHANGDTVRFGVAMPALELYRVLLDQITVHLHELFLGNAASKEGQMHQEMIGFYQARIEKFWRNWNPPRIVRTRIDINPFMM